MNWNSPETRSADVPHTTVDKKFQAYVDELLALDPSPSTDQLIKSAAWLFGEHAFDQAARVRDRVDLLVEKKEASYLKLSRSIDSKRGNISGSLAASYQLMQQRQASNLSVRLLEGRMREISGWIPTIAGEYTPLTPSSTTTVVHLVKESAPYLSNGFCSRSHYNFKAELAAGLKPIVLTEPGYPWNVAGAQDARTEMRLDGIGHYHFDLGSASVKDLPVDQMLEMWADLAYQKIKIIRPALIHASSGRRGYETALVGLALKRKTGLPFVYEVRSFFEANWTAENERESTGEIFERRMATELLCMQEADRVLTIGEAMREDLINRGISAEKIDIIPNGVDTEIFTKQDRDENLAGSLGLEGLPTFGYVSNMDHYRESQETLVHAAAVLQDRGSNLHCVIVGDGPRRTVVESLAAELGVADRIHFLGRVQHEDIPAYYSLIDIFVVPRISERAATYVTPLKPFEAMATGRPVVTSDLPALREIVSAPQRGLTFPAGDHHALATLLQELENNSERRKQLAEAGYEWASTQRSWTSNGPRYVDAFAKVTSNWPGTQRPSQTETTGATE
ncbi:glycosyltransferase family 4 protein [Kocuria sp.]|uniref:glycosyltransferase family 4 protein n=1 Tax=Kocuria sp. TaxID=1871328 RepID=UPI0026DEF715|nr:glycosyltransferase family 4 protein [Kocuria sp.]MDO5617807.1 glycosyltransferase family 4 protein [Kocuria sp.]